MQDQAQKLAQELQDRGATLEYQGTANPSKAVCNNCDSTIEYNLLKNPQALLITLTDSLGGEVFYCPNCGPIDADSLDGVRIE